MPTWVDIDQLHFSQLRPHRRVAQIPAVLLDSVRRFGATAPVVVRTDNADARGGYEILSNAQTWLAVQRAGQYQVPIEVRDDLSDEAALALIHADNPTGEGDPLNEAVFLKGEVEAIAKGGGYGAITKVARQQGLSRSHVSHSLRLLELPDDVLSLIRNGQLCIGHAKPLVGVTDPEDCRALARRVAVERMSVRSAEKLVREHRAGIRFKENEQTAESKDPDVARLERRVGELLGCPVNIRSTTFEIQFDGQAEVLEGLLERIGYTDR